MFTRPLLGVGIVLLSLMPGCVGAVEIPPALGTQIERVAELLRDPYASEYEDARMMQRTRTESDALIVLVVFSLEGFGGGNNHTQFLAAFEPEARDDGPLHYRLLDVIPIGGKGGRAVQELAARTHHDPKARQTLFLIDVFENGPSDPLNFPTKPAVATVKLKDGRLTEIR